MTDEGAGQGLARVDLERMVALVEQDWTLQEATPAEEGRSAVYHLTVETPAGPRERVLKATPGEDRSPGIDVEARVLAVVQAHTDLPVPKVYGAVDAHADLRAPYFLMEAMAGDSVAMADVGGVPDGVLRSVARQTGRQLATLHAVEPPGGFGPLTWESASLNGGQPSGVPGSLVPRDGSDDWNAVLADWSDGLADGVAGTRFADLAPWLRRALHDRADEVSGPLAPVLGRLDHGLPNLLLDREAGRVTAALDWESTRAVAAAYDLATVERILPGASWTALSSVPDRRELVAAALKAGYSERAPLPAGLAGNRSWCRVEHLAVAMQSLDGGRLGAALAPDRVEAVADRLRATVHARFG